MTKIKFQSSIIKIPSFISTVPSIHIVRKHMHLDTYKYTYEEISCMQNSPLYENENVSSIYLSLLLLLSLL